MPKKFTDQNHRELYLSLLENCRDRIESARILRAFKKDLTASECAHVGLEIAIKSVCRKFLVPASRTHNLTTLTKEFRNAVNSGKIPVQFDGVLSSLEAQFGALAIPYWTPQDRYSRRHIDSEDFAVLMSSVDIAEDILRILSR